MIRKLYAFLMGSAIGAMTAAVLTLSYAVLIKRYGDTSIELDAEETFLNWYVAQFSRLSPTGWHAVLYALIALLVFLIVCRLLFSSVRKSQEKKQNEIRSIAKAIGRYNPSAFHEYYYGEREQTSTQSTVPAGESVFYTEGDDENDDSFSNKLSSSAIVGEKSSENQSNALVKEEKTLFAASSDQTSSSKLSNLNNFIKNQLRFLIDRVGAYVEKTLESPNGKTKLFLVGSGLGLAVAVACILPIICSTSSQSEDYKLNRKTKTFVRYYGNASQFTVPRGVTAVEKDAFKDCASLTSITLPKGVVEVGAQAFQNCSNLRSIVLPEGLKEIEESAFSGCAALSSVSLPESVENIGQNAFKGCSSLTSASIPAGVKIIRDGMFEECDKLETVVLPDGIQAIGNSAFWDCSSLLSINVPDSVETIEDLAFGDCKALKLFILPPNVNTLGASAFLNCSSLESIVVPETTTSIGDSAFANCRSLTMLVFKGSVAEQYAQRNNLSYEILGNDDESLGVKTIEDNRESAEYKIESDETSMEYLIGGDGTVFESYLGSAQSFTVPEFVKTIGVNAFRGCSTLKTVHIPESVNAIQEGAFKGCGALTEITLPKGVAQIEAEVFYGCDSLKIVAFSNDVRVLKTHAFAGCASLENFWVPQNTAQIESRAFSGCRSLRTITIPNPSTLIADGAFEGCDELTIRAPKGSKAEQYAKENGISFESFSEDVGKSEPQAGDGMELTIKGAAFVFRYCPPGSFKMGSPENEKGPRVSETQRVVTLTRGYWIQETETTQAQWKAITNQNPSRFADEKSPVESVDWHEFQRFVRKLNDLNVAPVGYKFALPTEAQWEYAARAGTTDLRYGKLDEIAWYGNNSSNRTHNVAQKTPNAWGLYDMIGNVWEWTSDTMVNVSSAPQTDPFNAGKIDSGRCFCGGYYGSPQEQCRAAQHYCNPSEYKACDVGGRLALVPVDAPEPPFNE